MGSRGPEFLDLDPAVEAPREMFLEYLPFVVGKLVVDVADDQFLALTHRISQPSAFSIQRSTFRVQRSEFNVQRLSASPVTPAWCSCFLTTVRPWYRRVFTVL